MGFAATLASNVIYRILNIIFTVGTVVVFSRLCGPAGFGMFSLLLVNVALLNLVTSFGIDSSVTYHQASSSIVPGKIFSFIYMVLFLQLLAALLVELIFHATHQTYWILAGGSVRNLLVALALLIAISLAEKYTSLFNGKQLFSLVSAILAVTNALIFLVFLVIYFFDKHYPPADLIEIYVFAMVFQTLVLIVSYHTMTSTPLKWTRFSGADFKIFFSYSLLAFAANFLQFLAYRMDYWMIDYFSNEKALGIYALAVRLDQLFWILPLVFAGIIFPGVTASKNLYDHKPLLSLIRITNTINVALGLLALVVAPWLIPVLFGAEYQGSVAAFSILLPGIVIFSIATLLAAWFAGMKDLKTNLTGSAICLAIIAVLDILLIPRLGINGASLASSIGYSITGFYFIYRYCSTTGNPVGAMFFAGAEDWQKARSFFKGYINFRK